MFGGGEEGQPLRNAPIPSRRKRSPGGSAATAAFPKAGLESGEEGRPLSLPPPVGGLAEGPGWRPGVPSLAGGLRDPLPFLSSAARLRPSSRAALLGARGEGGRTELKPGRSLRGARGEREGKGRKRKAAAGFRAAPPALPSPPLRLFLFQPLPFLPRTLFHFFSFLFSGLTIILNFL